MLFHFVSSAFNSYMIFFSFSLINSQPNSLLLQCNTFGHWSHCVTSIILFAFLRYWVFLLMDKLLAFPFSIILSKCKLPLLSNFSWGFFFSFFFSFLIHHFLFCSLIFLLSIWHPQTSCLWVAAHVRWTVMKITSLLEQRSNTKMKLHLPSENLLNKTEFLFYSVMYSFSPSLLCCIIAYEYTHIYKLAIMTF